MSVERRPIRRVLVANRGEIAVRVIDGCHDLGIEAVAVYAEPDRHAPHVDRADGAVALGGTTATDTYLDQAKLLDAALTQRCDAVHPGYGFLSERAEFARAVVAAGLTWIGPHPEAIATMGDKLAAKELAAREGVPTLPSARLTGDAEFEWRAQAHDVGYPLLIKAAAGGGGRGMRLVAGSDDLADAVVTARREAEASFGDGTVFAERWLAAPRHIEVQVVADRHGHVIHLGERECSVQRRHQKLIEEAPSPAVDDERREALGLAATSLARAIGYDSVGTVEFLLDGATGEFFFLEMNTRIQVEHRVTEWIVGCDLVAMQIECARGDVLADDDELVIDRHAVEARIYAEDPARDWLGSTGTIHRFEAGWVLGGETDAGIRTGSVVTPDFDPLLVKVVASGATRAQAIARLVRSLRATVIHGVRTNRDYLVSVLEHPDFAAGDTTTLFVADHPALLDPAVDDELLQAHLVVAALRTVAFADRATPWGFAPVGWRNVGRAPVVVRFGHGDAEHEAEHEVRVTLGLDGAIEAGVDGAVVTGRVLGVEVWDHGVEPVSESTGDMAKYRAWHPFGESGALSVELDGVARRFATHRVGDVIYVDSSLGQTDLVVRPRFAESAAAGVAGGPTAPVPGRIIAVAVAVGDHVEPGQTLVVLEAMKVEHQVRAATAGVVAEILVQPGDTVDAHHVLIRLQESDDA